VPVLSASQRHYHGTLSNQETSELADYDSSPYFYWKMTRIYLTSTHNTGYTLLGQGWKCSEIPEIQAIWYFALNILCKAELSGASASMRLIPQA